MSAAVASLARLGVDSGASGAANTPKPPAAGAAPSGLPLSSVTTRSASLGPTPLARATAALSSRATAAARSAGGSTSSTASAARGPTPWMAVSAAKAARSSRERKP